MRREKGTQKQSTGRVSFDTVIGGFSLLPEDGLGTKWVARTCSFEDRGKKVARTGMGGGEGG